MYKVLLPILGLFTVSMEFEKLEKIIFRLTHTRETGSGNGETKIFLWLALSCLYFYRGRGRSPVKVTMQKLQMSTENQEMVKGMLRDLHGEDIEIAR